MALIVLLAINLLIIRINDIEAAHNTDTNVDNSPIAWIRKWCPFCEMFIVRLKVAAEAFSNTIYGDGTGNRTTPRRNHLPALIDKLQSSARNDFSKSNNRILSHPNDETVYLNTGNKIFRIDEKVPNPPDKAKVYMDDLESIVFHIINNDFARFNPLKVEGFNFLWFMRYFFPQKNVRVRNLLEELYEFMQEVLLTRLLERNEVRKKVIELGKKYPITPNKWISCRGSENKINCGLWLLFHTLEMNWTLYKERELEVNLYLQNLGAFVAVYHPDIFGDKMNDFQSLANKDSLSYLNSTMGLWDFHNWVRVSKGKPGFPSKYYCPDCNPEDDIHFNPNRVYFFLVKMYTKIYSREAEINEWP